MVINKEDDEYLTVCCECGNLIEGDEIYYAIDGDYCAWCHTAYFGDDEEGKHTYQESQI